MAPTLSTATLPTLVDGPQSYFNIRYALGRSTWTSRSLTLSDPEGTVQIPEGTVKSLHSFRGLDQVWHIFGADRLSTNSLESSSSLFFIFASALGNPVKSLSNFPGFVRSGRPSSRAPPRSGHASRPPTVYNMRATPSQRPENHPSTSSWTPMTQFR